MRVLWAVRDLQWRIHRYFTDNWKYIERYRKTKNLDDLEKYIRKSKSIDFDIDEVVHWGRCYDYSVNGTWCHAHSLKELLLSIMYTIRVEDKNATFEFDEEDYHKDELEVLNRFIELLKGEKEVL